MKKNNIIGIVVGVICFILTFYGGNLLFNKPVKNKEFSKAGMHFTLTGDFVEKEYVNFTAYYQSATALVMTLKEEFSVFEEYGVDSNMSLEEYANLVINSNKLTTDVLNKNNLIYFIYEKDVNGKNFMYYATVFRGNDAYWLIQFACETKNYAKMEKEFIKWAQTVQFY